MKAVPQELLKEYIKSQQFTSTAEIMEVMKEMFRDAVQTVEGGVCSPGCPHERPKGPPRGLNWEA